MKMNDDDLIGVLTIAGLSLLSLSPSDDTLDLCDIHNRILAKHLELVSAWESDGGIEAMQRFSPLNYRCLTAIEQWLRAYASAYGFQA